MSGRGRSHRGGGRGGGNRGARYQHQGRGGGRQGGRGGGRQGGRGSEGRGSRGGVRGGRGGGRQPDKDKRNINREIQVSVNAFELQGGAHTIDPKDFITGDIGILSKTERLQALASSGLQPTQYLVRSDGSVLLDPQAPPAKIEALWSSGAYRRGDVLSVDVAGLSLEEEKEETKTPDKIALVDAAHRVWDIKGDGFERTGGFVFSTRLTPRDSIVPGVAIRTGHFQSIRQEPEGGQGRSFLVTKPVAAPVTVRETLMKFLQGLKLMNPNGQMTNVRAAGDAVRGLFVSSHHNTYKIHLRLDGVQSRRDPSQVGARNTFFEKNGKQVSVFDHFKETHKITLQFPNTPLAYRRAKDHFVFVPMELLSLVAGKVRQSIQSDEILKRSKMSADEFMKKCKEKAEKTDQFVKHLKRAGDMIISRASLNGVSPDYLKATALVLPTPKVSVKDSRSKQDVDFEPEGNWNWRNRAALVPPSVAGATGLKIGFVDGSNDHSALNNCMSPLCDELKIHTGKNVQSVSFGAARLTDKKGLDKLVKQAKQSKVDCLVVLVPEQNNSAAYKAVKSVCDTNSLPSQCVKKWRSPLNAQHARNLVLKMNGKIGGINHSVRNVAFAKYMPLQDKTMNTLFIGIDVYHGGADALSDPADDKSASGAKSQSSSSSGDRPDSTLAVVGMFGPDLRRTTVALQNVPGGTEIMPVGFDAVIRRCLDGWRKVTKKKMPSTVVIYRDGIGTSSYDMWYETEIEKGFRAVLPRETKLVVILATKRHDVRFSVERNGQQTNLDSGTVVHKMPLLENNQSFYLQSYKALSAGLTARATHYQVFDNDCGWSTRFVYDLTYALTHMQQRASGAVAIPAPVAAADLAAYRARLHLRSPENLRKLEGTGQHQWFL